jgi:hypothetical protein
MTAYLDRKVRRGSRRSLDATASSGCSGIRTGQQLANGLANPGGGPVHTTTS